MSAGTATVVRGAECRKFTPNIFNKSKCSSCFKQKEEHSAEALECNRATRKISKCGYLFVAPGWDFSNPLNRTKRWQRRWFVLYDDGELTYSVDEHPETVPQARIDMTRVLEVAAAEDITGHPYSLAITSPEGVTFVKGTCREETRWWADVLQVYSRNKGRHKRNATFPGSQATILQVTPTIRSNTPNPARPRFNSCRSEPRCGAMWIPESSNASELCPSVFPPPAALSSLNSNSNNSNNIVPLGTRSTTLHSNTEVADVAANESRSGTSSLENGTSSGNNFLTSSSNNICSTVTTTSSSASLNGNIGANQVSGGLSHQQSTSNASNNAASSGLGVLSEKPPMVPSESRSPAYRDQPPSGSSPPTRDKLRAEDKARRRVGQMTERNSSIAGVAATTNEKLEDDTCRRIFLEHEREKEGKLRDIAASLTQPRVRRIKPRSLEPTRDVVDASSATQRDKLIRGDPDGCGLDISTIRYSPTSELRVDLPAENVLNIKKGWLMKQGLNKEWNKHWFVLRGCGLMYYRDPCAEDKGIMDGVIDLNTVTAVTPLQVARNYGFQTMAWDERGTTVLSAVTAGIRSSWMAAIRKAANLPDPDSNGEALPVCPDVQQENNPQSPTTSITDRERDSVAPPTSVTPRSVLFSSDEEYRTASEGGRRESGDWSELPVSPPLIRNGEWSLKGSNWSDTTTHEWSELPPSPPLTRTALSRVKARSRSSSRSRVYKRSRSSPPSSRRSTLDSVRSEDLMMACCGELGEDEEPMVELLENRVSLLREQLDQNQSSAHPSALLVVVERQENEIETLKSQLSAARADASATEKELARLRQQKAEATIREKQVEELLSSIQRTEQQRSKDLDDLEKMKKLCAREKEMLECKLLETEAILRETTERCEMLSNELATSHRSVEHLQAEVQTLSDRLSQGIEENERLYNRIRELEERGGLSTARERGRSFDSLSDLTNVDLDMDLSTLDKERIVEEYDELRSRFEKAISEIRAMRKELREAHSTQDALELEIFAYKQDAVGVNETNQAQVQLMAARIQDLTNKLAASEKQVRTLKQKLTKAESREKRRSLSLKGKESFQISQEMEDKLVDLENKICAIERGNKCSGSENSKESSPSSKKERKRNDQRSLDRANLRRKSLDSATSSEPMKVLIRLSSLETKVANVVESVANSDVEKDSSECSEAGGASPCGDMSAKLLFRLKKLERVVWKSKRKLEQCLNSAQPDKEKAERCLHEVNDLLHSCGEQKKGQVDSQESQQSASVLVSRLEAILKDKLSELMKRRQVLAQNERLDEREKVRLIAERVAFESVILGQLKRAIRGVSLDRSAVLSDLLETSQLASSLKRKLHGTKPKTYQKTSYVQYLSRVLADRLVLVGGVLPKEEGPSEKEECEEEMEVQALRNESLSLLLQRQKELEELVRCYKDKRLKELAESLAAETFNMSSSSSSSSSEEEKFSKKLSDDRRVREAWSLAHETLNKELVQAEIARVMTHCAQLYEQDTQPSILDACLSLSQTSGVSMETWGDEARCKLREEIDLAIQELCCSYKDFLRAMKRNKSCKVNELKPPLESPHQLLTDYADVIAHKALMDARIAVLRKNASKLYSPSSSASNFHGETFVSSLIEKEDLLALLTGESESELQAFGSPLLDAEFQYLYEKSREDCENRISGKWESKEQVKSMSQNLAYLEEDLTGLCKSIKEKTAEKLDDPICRLDHSASRTATDWSSVCDKCSQLREHVKRLNDYVTSATCKRCSQLQESMERLRARHQEELESLKRNQEKDLMEIRGELDSQRQSLTNQYEQEAATLRERARKLEHRLNAMDSEHSAHVNELRAAYQRSMSAELDTDAETRKRYKEEIKHLRALCEKGLIAMENSHRRIISELEEKHKQELENLRVEKEQALSEETQATLAALDAMRKAHEHEVQKEIAKFKQEFVKQMQAREDIGILHKEHEEEMEEIKQEILSLSAKYSSKCVESAALEERVGSLTKQLAQAQQHIMQLDARNKQLRAHLVLDCNDAGVNDAIQILRGPESGSNEAIQQHDEIHRLQQHVKHGELARSSHRVDSRTRARAEHEDDLQERSRDNEEEDNEREEATRASDDCQKSGVQSGELEKQQQHSQTAVAAPSAAFSYRLERVRSISLPYTNNLVKSTGNSGAAGGSATSNASSTTLWDSLRSRSGLPQQYQGTEDR